MKNRIYTLSAAVFAVLAVVFIVAATLIHLPKKSKEVLRIGVMPDVDSIQAAVAAECVDFVETVTFFDAVSRNAALESGEIDLCISDLLTVAKSVENGRQTKILTVTSGRYTLVANVADLHSVDPESVAVSTGTVIEYTAWRLFGVKDFLPITSVSTRYAALCSGSCDAAILPEPFATKAAEKDGLYSVKTLENSGVGVLVCGKTEGKAKLISAYLDAWNTAADILSDENNSVSLDKIAKKLSLPDGFSKVSLPEFGHVTLPDSDVLTSVCTFCAIYDSKITSATAEKIEESFWKS